MKKKTLILGAYCTECEMYLYWVEKDNIDNNINGTILSTKPKKFFGVMEKLVGSKYEPLASVYPVDIDYYIYEESTRVIAEN